MYLGHLISSDRNPPYLEANNFTPSAVPISASDLSVSLTAIYQSNRFNFSSPTLGRTYAYSLTDIVVICDAFDVYTLRNCYLKYSRHHRDEVWYLQR